jgi:hypothetical protein
MPAAKKTTRAKAKAKKGAARKRAAPKASLVAALAEAAWADTDLSLAQALADLDEALIAEGAERDAALDMLSQSLARAARRRGMTRIGELGVREAYDPRRHDLAAPVAKKSKTVRIHARGVARGQEILVKPRVGPLRRKT